MQTKALIKVLQDLVDKHDNSPGMLEIFGEHEISIDAYRKLPGTSGMLEYIGISSTIGISYSSDGSYCILTPAEGWLAPKEEIY